MSNNQPNLQSYPVHKNYLKIYKDLGNFNEFKTNFKTSKTFRA